MTWLWITLAAVVLLAGALVPVLLGRQRQRLSSDDEAIAARSRHNKLGLYVETPGDSDLLKRARERWVTAGSVLASARSEEDFKLAERICDEGLAMITQVTHDKDAANHEKDAPTRDKNAATRERDAPTHSRGRPRAQSIGDADETGR
jgi:hypothetical protein